VANAEINFDPTNKLRTSSPQALIDTDFEYGTQVSKWENLAMTNNRPFAYAVATSLPATAMTINGRTVTVTSATTPAVGTPIIVNDSYLSIANGVFVIETVSSGVSFTYTARATSSLAGGTSIFDSNKTSVTQGIYYSGSAVNSSALTQAAFATDNLANASKITVTLSNAHGLSLGNEIQVYSANAGAISSGMIGAFYVAQVISPTSFAYYARQNVSAIASASDYQVYARTQGQVLHRPFDGGVIFSSNAGSNYETQIRQTRRYFRYQSGKGIQISSGTILKPNFQVEKLSYAQSTGLITITFKDAHNIQTVPPDAQITIAGANEDAFNGTYFVTNVLSYNSVTITPAVGKFTADATASGTYYVSTSGWYGAVNRLGIFDQQNGLFFEFDGQTLFAVRRSSTYQLSGRANVTNGSTAVTVSSLATFANAVYTKQLTGGDYVVIKGQSYRVESVTDDSNFTISPAYRGATASNLIISKTVDTKMPQSQWNLDTMDGKGPSGYNIDLSKMQMFYIDYSWYGAGFIRWGLRGTNGDVLYVHKMANNNVNQEAYMRSGNLPGRYESGTIPPVTAVTSAVSTNATIINVADTRGFPSSGVLFIKNYNTIEHVYYTAKSATTFNNVVRAQAGAGTGTAPITTTTTAGSNIMTVATTGVQIGQRVIATSATALSDGTFVTAIGAGTVTLSQAALSANPSVIFVPMGATTGQSFSPATNPVTVELGYPTLAPTISHWGTSVIMDGRFDDDKSLLFTYGQKSLTGITPVGTLAIASGTITSTTTLNSATVTLSATTGVVVGMGIVSANLPANTIITSISGTTITVNNPATAGASGASTSFTVSNSAALMAIRVAPSVDNGIPSTFGARELINRMQLVLRSLDVSLIGSGNILVQAVLNNSIGSTIAWTNAVGGVANVPTSSLAQIADYAGKNVGLAGAQPGEVTGGFFVSTTGSIDLEKVRDLGNSVLGGGATTAGNDFSNVNIYPNGPDVLTIFVTNVGSTGVALSSRLSWTEAQA
jgi:hypothetical protein